MLLSVHGERRKYHMAAGYHHITYAGRCQIQALKRSGMSVSAIAKQLGRHRSTIYREIARNSGQRGYRHKQAQERARQRRRAASGAARKMTAALWELVERKLAKQWSPEQIAGRLRREGQAGPGHVWIYRHVWEERRAGGSLYRHLRQRGKKRKLCSVAGRGHIPGRVDISERPAIVEGKTRVGDLEADTIIGARHQGALVSLVDRASKYTFLQAVSHKTAAAVGGAIIELLEPVKGLVRTITSDNGKEFADHQAIAAQLGAGFYFATPYHSWERGLNEHTNGLVRQYYPKSAELGAVNPAALQQVAELLNNRPRKALGYRTPAAVFKGALAASRQAC